MYFLTWWLLVLPFCDGKMWLVLFIALFDKGALFPSHHFSFQVVCIGSFSQTLRRYTSLNHLAQAARAVLQNSAQINQMLSDLNRVDFNNVQVCQYCCLWLLLLPAAVHQWFLNKTAECSLRLPASPSGTGILGLSVWRPCDPEAGARL